MAVDSRSPRDDKHLEVLGYYNPLPGQNGGKRMGVNFDRVKGSIFDFKSYEVKECAISCTGLVSTFGDNIKKKLPRCLPILADWM
ncbi:hypothetical protein OROHE_006265 [Orobanche hederae]